MASPDKLIRGDGGRRRPARLRGLRLRRRGGGPKPNRFHSGPRADRGTRARGMGLAPPLGADHALIRAIGAELALAS